MKSYKGKLTGQQIDALPEAVTGLEERVVNIEDCVGLGGNRMDIIALSDTDIAVDGENVHVPAKKRTVLTPEGSVILYGKDIYYLRIYKYKGEQQDFFRMFYKCSSLLSIEVWNMDTSNATNMGSMFYGCTSLKDLKLGNGFFRCKASSIDFSRLQYWTGETMRESLVDNSYDRAANGLSTLTLMLHANTKAKLTDDDKAALTAKGYIIS